MWIKLHCNPEEAAERETTLHHANEIAAGMKATDKQAAAIKPTIKLASKLLEDQGK